jgi:ADP-ribosyl-[dinitrogen reductase] hydrolase
MSSFPEKILSGLMGVCVGDALGVPVEFTSRDQRVQDPVIGMRGYGTYNQPPGTWSDDSSLTFCLVEALCQEGIGEGLFQAIATNFCRWYREGYWTPDGVCFDIGNTTLIAIENLQQGVNPMEAGETSERSNGNGSLMRILPLAYCYQLLDFPDLINLVHQVSAITHGHLRAKMSCGIYISIAVKLLEEKDKFTAYLEGIQTIKNIYSQNNYLQELSHFNRIFNHNITDFSEDEIRSSGYVIDALEASLWCFLKSNSYSETVLKAVNLGSDTDTTAAITGGLAGIYYGLENIPSEWIEIIGRKQDIFDLAERFSLSVIASNGIVRTV